MRPRVLLPQPDSPTRPTTSPSADVEIDVGDRLHDGLVHAGAEGIGDPAGEIDPLDEALGDAAQGEEWGRHWLMNGPAFPACYARGVQFSGRNAPPSSGVLLRLD